MKLWVLALIWAVNFLPVVGEGAVGLRANRTWQHCLIQALEKLKSSPRGLEAAIDDLSPMERSKLSLLNTLQDATERMPLSPADEVAESRRIVSAASAHLKAAQIPHIIRKYPDGHSSGRYYIEFKVSEAPRGFLQRVVKAVGEKQSGRLFVYDPIELITAKIRAGYHIEGNRILVSHEVVLEPDELNYSVVHEIAHSAGIYRVSTGRSDPYSGVIMLRDPTGRQYSGEFPFDEIRSNSLDLNSVFYALRNHVRSGLDPKEIRPEIASLISKAQTVEEISHRAISALGRFQAVEVCPETEQGFPAAQFYQITNGKKVPSALIPLLGLPNKLQPGKIDPLLGERLRGEVNSRILLASRVQADAVSKRIFAETVLARMSVNKDQAALARELKIIEKIYLSVIRDPKNAIAYKLDALFDETLKAYPAFSDQKRSRFRAIQKLGQILGCSKPNIHRVTQDGKSYSLWTDTASGDSVIFDPESGAFRGFASGTTSGTTAGTI